MPTATCFPHLLGCGRGALARPGCQAAEGVHAQWRAQGLLTVQQGVGSRALSWHLQGWGSRKCPRGMAQGLLFCWDFSWPIGTSRPG